jgi:MoaA/NifB/PqqE/SkfB family radical SAM enzyme
MKKSLLELELTNKCNARCIMCPVFEMKRKKGFMTRETFELIIKKGEDYGVETIRFCGLGEPLLHEDIGAYISYVKNYTNCRTELITNGALLTKKNVQFLAENNLDSLSISFPSIIADNYESIMKGLDFKKVSKRVSYAINELKKDNDTGTHIKITCVITDINRDEKNQLEQYWTRLGVDSILLYTPHNRGGYLEHAADLNLPPAKENASTSGLPQRLCPWPLRNFYIAWDGSVYLCCCDLEGECKVGDVYHDEFNEIERAQELMQIRQPSLCRRCSFQGAKLLLEKEIRK